MTRSTPKLPAMPDYLPRELAGEWRKVFDHLVRSGDCQTDLDAPLIESWLINVWRLRQAYRAIESDGPFPGGKAHPAQTVVTQATLALSKVAQTLGASGTVRMQMVAMAKLEAAKKVETDGAWASAASETQKRVKATAKKKVFA